MSAEAAFVLAAVVGLYACAHLAILYLLKRGFRWIADTIDRFCGLEHK